MRTKAGEQEFASQIAGEPGPTTLCHRASDEIDLASMDGEDRTLPQLL